MMSFIIKKPIAPPPIPEIINNLASDATDKTLAAAQGKALAQAIAGLNNLSLSTIINTIYPIGSIIELSNYLDPNTVLTGTTWAEYGQGRVTVAQGDDFATLGAIGGQKSVKMTANMLIEHDHEYLYWSPGGDDMDGMSNDAVNDTSELRKTTKTGSADPEPIPTMPPYIVVKRWRRTA